MTIFSLKWPFIRNMCVLLIFQEGRDTELIISTISMGIIAPFEKHFSYVYRTVRWRTYPGKLWVI